MKISVKHAKTVKVSVPKVKGAGHKKPAASHPHFRMRKLSPMGHPSNSTAPGESGGPAFPNSVPPDAGGPQMAFGGGDMGMGGGAPDGGGGPPPAMPGM